MDVLAGRKTGGEIEGDILINVRPTHHPDCKLTRYLDCQPRPCT